MCVCSCLLVQLDFAKPFRSALQVVDLIKYIAAK